MVNPQKPYNSQQWTTARMRSFVMSAIRRCRWPAKYDALRAAFAQDGINPKTNRKCKLYRCAETGVLLPAKDVQIDHKEPVIPQDAAFGNTTEWLGYNWNEVLQRMFCEVEGFQVIGKEAHKAKTKQENDARRQKRVDNSQ
jgi:hypothetical protein